MRKVSKGSTGAVWKNDVNARGCGVTREGILKRKHYCSACSKTIGNTETILYVFAARGTQSAASIYVHQDCIPQYKMGRQRTWAKCRICEEDMAPKGQLCFKLGYGRRVWIHEECLDRAPRETKPVDEIIAQSKKRAMSRLKRGEILYTIDIKPYNGLKLDRTKSRFTGGGTSKCWIKIRPYDGKIKEVYNPPTLYLFCSGHWVKEKDLRKIVNKYNEDQKAKFWAPRGDKISETRVLTLLQLQKDLQQHYDKRGRPIEERLDTDYELRFLLEHGNSIGGVVNDEVE